MASHNICQVQDGRHFHNHYPDYEFNVSEVKDGKVSQTIIRNIEKNIQKLLDILEREFDNLDDSNTSIYTGTAGIAYFYMRLSRSSLPDKNGKWALDRAMNLLSRCRANLHGKKQTFICGDAGPLILMAITEPDRADHYVKRILEMGCHVCRSSDIPDEIFNGRVGYLYSLLYLRKNSFCVPDDLISQVVSAVLNSGRSSAQQRSQSGDSCPPLWYEWHEKPYLGAAHGITGIMCVLLQTSLLGGGHVTETALAELVRPTLDWLASLRFPSGNYPSSLGSSTGDKLVHWCHGAPGWVYMFLLAHKVFGAPEYLSRAEECGDVVWTRGLLEKGYGLCHGAAGNAYVFLALFNYTHEDKHLYRAVKFAEWCCDYGKHNCRCPDRPMSLYEGMAGTLYFLVEMLEPQSAKLPAFEL